MKSIVWNIALAVSFALCLPQFLEARLSPQRSVKVEFRFADEKPAKGLTEALVTGTDEKLYLHEHPVITITDIAEARAVKSQYEDSYEIDITFTKEGAEKMASATKERIGQKMAIVIDGKVISAPTINSQITDRCNITGIFKKEEAEKIAEGLNNKVRTQ